MCPLDTQMPPLFNLITKLKFFEQMNEKMDGQAQI